MDSHEKLAGVEVDLGDADFIDATVQVAPGIPAYVTVNPVDSFVVFDVRLDPWSTVPSVADGAGIQWFPQLICKAGRWYNVLRLDNNSTSTISVQVRVKSLK